MSQAQELDKQSSSKTGSLLAPPSLRPRNKRLISGLDEFPSFDAEDREAAGEGKSGSPRPSRAASPIPSKHPSRSSSIRPPGRSFSSQSSPSQARNSLQPDYGGELAASLSGLWGKSWTNLQSIASNVLGSDATQELYKDKAAQRQRRPYEATHSKDRTLSAWGPRSREEHQPGGGSKEERAAKVRQEKRKELLAQGGSYGDAKSKIKRRLSDDFESASAPPGEHDDRDTLIYIHVVQPNDTLAGISIKYNTQMTVIKKSNRLWSNDGVQFRKTLMLPLDSCGIRGRPVAAPGDLATDLLDAVEDEVETPRAEQGEFAAQRTNSTSTIKPRVQAAVHSRQSSTQSVSISREEPPWKHDSWVVLEGHTVATEIARIPRRELGYFPKGRRRSVAYSDFDTPSTSLDMSRASAAPSMAPSIAPSAAPSEASSFTKGHHARRSSSANQWAQQMMGPGGVGKLNSKGVSVPGPALDKLNKTFGKHLPNMASGEAENAVPVGLQNIGGAIEGWVRNLSKTAAKLVEAPPSSQQRRRNHTGIEAGPGDLIELDHSFELGDDDDDDAADLPDPAEFVDEQERGRSRGSTMVSGYDQGNQLVRERGEGGGSSLKKKGQ